MDKHWIYKLVAMKKQPTDADAKLFVEFMQERLSQHDVSDIHDYENFIQDWADGFEVDADLLAEKVETLLPSRVPNKPSI